ncbi:MAG: cell division protein FtsL, partial [Lachnospiraceae bacterium]|nr:cell division protein FtsL [Lachnospiraceae bacterium]
NPAYILFLTFAMVCTVAICIQYLMMRAQMTNMVKELSALEITLNELKAENDDTENRIKGAVDLEEIKYRAMNELGMQYANEDQIVSYECEDTDYVRQLVDIE